MKRTLRGGTLARSSPCMSRRERSVSAKEICYLRISASKIAAGAAYLHTSHAGPLALQLGLGTRTRTRDRSDIGPIKGTRCQVSSLWRIFIVNACPTGGYAQPISEHRYQEDPGQQAGLGPRPRGTPFKFHYNRPIHMIRGGHDIRRVNTKAPLIQFAQFSIGRSPLDIMPVPYFRSLSRRPARGGCARGRTFKLYQLRPF